MTNTIRASFPISANQGVSQTPTPAPAESAELPASSSLAGGPVVDVHSETIPVDRNKPTELALSLVSGGNKSALKPGEKDKEVLKQKAEVDKQIHALMGEKNGTNPSFRTYSGKDRGEIVVVIEYTDEQDKRQIVENLQLKEAVRELHRLILGPPAQSQPFERPYIPGFKTDPLYFFQKDGHFDRMWKFVEAQKPGRPIKREEMFAKIHATRTYIKTVLQGMKPIVEKRREEIREAAHSASHPKARKVKEDELRELERIYFELLRVTQDTKESNAELLMLNWAVGVNDAKLINQGLQQILYEEDAVIANRSAFSFLNPFGKVGPGSLPLEQRREWSHSAAALTLYLDEQKYAELCDHCGRNMKADCSLRLIVTNVSNALADDNTAPELSFAGGPLLCNEELTPIFKTAATATKAAYTKALQVTQKQPRVPAAEWFSTLLAPSSSTSSKNPSPAGGTPPSSDSNTDSE